MKQNGKKMKKKNKKMGKPFFFVTKAMHQHHIELRTILQLRHLFLAW